jgi:heme-degrading monooxygenase HmoA
VNTNQNGRNKKMAYMLVRQEVQDYETWKSFFDMGGDLRRRNGAKSYRILRSENGSSEVFALFEWDNLDNARRFASSAELKEAMQRAGVVGKPEVLFLEEASRG